MKMHIGVDNVSGAIHSLEPTPAYVHDIHSDGLRREGESRAWRDAGYTGIYRWGEYKERNLDWFK